MPAQRLCNDRLSPGLHHVVTDSRDWFVAVRPGLRWGVAGGVGFIGFAGYGRTGCEKCHRMPSMNGRDAVQTRLAG